MKNLLKIAVAATLLVAACATTCAAQQPGAATPDDTPAANPSRPTVTNPATLPPVGYLQFEQGYLGSLHSPETDTQYGVNQFTKIAVQARLMLFAGFQPFARSGVSGGNATGATGAIQIGAQVVAFTPGSKPAPPQQPAAHVAAAAPDAKSPIPTVALQYSHTVYAGNTPDIDLGSSTNAFALLLSGDIGSFHYDTNYIATEQNGTSDLAPRPIRRAQFGQTLSVNHTVVSPLLQLSVELYHFTQPLVEATSAGLPIARANLVGLLFAPSFQLRPNLVLDAGFEHGLTSTSTQWQSFAGFTYLLPKRLWRER